MGESIEEKKNVSELASCLNKNVYFMLQYSYIVRYILERKREKLLVD